MMKYGFVLMVSFLMSVSAPALADDAVPEFTLTIKDHTFTPAELELPAGKRVKLVIDNQDPTPEEFESHKLKAEKVIPGGSKGIVFVGPLEPGEYRFFGEFNEDKAKGKITVK